MPTGWDMPLEERNLLTTGQAAKICSVTPDTILKWIKKGRLPGVRTAGGHYRIQRQDIEPLVASPRPAESPAGQSAQCFRQKLRCWEYLGNQGSVRDDCLQCVVYRVRAARCFEMAGLEVEGGGGHRLCRSSCEECVYYRRINGLPTNVLLITHDNELVDHLSHNAQKSIILRVARNAYEASAIIHEFRPAFVTVDMEPIPPGDTELLDSLSSDPRVPGLRIVLAVPPGTRGRRRLQERNDWVVDVLEKPFGTQQMAEVIDRYPVDPLTLEGTSL